MLRNVELLSLSLDLEPGPYGSIPEKVAERVDEDSWEGYDSVQMFPGCDCGHDATEHKAAWGDWREHEGCALCPCEAEWEHT